jgi:prepilin-type processing-associated H-X9-DG protein/prepilin-type N-terminal cleavage/methylation domain-containing protein
VRISGFSRRAFTLVELLVVIGIISVLIGILLPTLKGARRQANLVQCASNQRNLIQACQMHAQEHGGYLPLAGSIVMDPMGPGMFNMAAGVNDSRRSRYDYAKVEGTTTFSFVPLPGALAPYLGVTNLPSDFYAMDQALNARDGVWRRFMCPDTNALEKAKLNDDPNDTNVVDQGMMMIPQVGTLRLGWWATNSDYGINEGVFGYHYDSRYAQNRVGGHLARVKRSAEVAVFTDAIARKTPVDGSPCGWICWSPSLGGAGAATLGDAFAGSARAESAENFDRNRHGKRMNIAFADGHVETVRIEKQSLDLVYLIPPP